MKSIATDRDELPVGRA